MSESKIEHADWDNVVAYCPECNAGIHRTAHIVLTIYGWCWCEKCGVKITEPKYLEAKK